MLSVNVFIINQVAVKPFHEIFFFFVFEESGKTRKEKKKTK